MLLGNNAVNSTDALIHIYITQRFPLWAPDHTSATTHAIINKYVPGFSIMPPFCDTIKVHMHMVLLFADNNEDSFCMTTLRPPDNQEKN